MMCFIQQLGFCIVQFWERSTYTLCGLKRRFVSSQSVFFLTTEFCNLLYRWRLILTFSMLEDWDKQFTHCVGSTRKKCFLPCCIRVKEKQIFFLCVKCFISEADEISAQHTGFFIVNTINGFISRISDLLNILRNLDLRLEFSICVLNSGQFINTAKGRAVFDVIRFVPTPQEEIAAPCILRSWIRNSSRSLEAAMTASWNPASSSILRAF